jgi:hypothetical protein
MVPGYSESRIEFYRDVQQQRAFVMECSVKPSITPREHQRLVRILGGAEKLLSHPMDEVWTGNLLNPQPGALADWFGSAKTRPSLFAFLTNRAEKQMRDGLYPYTATADISKESRICVAVTVLKHFPRYLYGAYSAKDVNDTTARKKVENAARELVERCEDVVKAIEPLGVVGNKVLDDAVMDRDDARGHTERFGAQTRLGNTRTDKFLR